MPKKVKVVTDHGKDEGSYQPPTIDECIAEVVLTESADPGECWIRGHVDCVLNDLPCITSVAHLHRKAKLPHCDAKNMPAPSRTRWNHISNGPSYRHDSGVEYTPGHSKTRRAPSSRNL